MRPGFASLPAELRAQIAEELNVHALETLATVDDELVDYVVKPNFRALGGRFGKATPTVAKAIGAADATALAADLRDGRGGQRHRGRASRTGRSRTR